MSGTIIAEKFGEWIAGKDPGQARIAVFEHTRDIPYAIIPELRDPYSGPAGMLNFNKGSCQPKHFLLAQLFSQLKIPVKYASYPFRWSDCDIKYPQEIERIIKKLPVTCHLACKAYIGNKWVLVDATYDLPLKKAGFPVNEDWDGVSATQNAVRPLEEALQETIEERTRYDAGVRSLYSEEEKALYAEFIEKFNRWLDRIRGA